MLNIDSPFAADQWMANVFSAKAVRDGHVIRRKLAHIDRFVGRERFMAELSRRGWHAVENSGQMVIFCNQEPIRVIL